MADKKAKSVREAIESAPVVAEETAFLIDELRAQSRKVFGVRSEIVDGALFEYTGDKITKTDAKALITKFLREKAEKEEKEVKDNG
ncbi:hypothetical protein [Listeria booriae]|uniref:hypothetical protein n=1 Tax=Listeria booriae TaxID=1552123 RepID=UPI0021ADE188|nr:hypothetical protein [Listeria booriae]